MSQYNVFDGQHSSDELKQLSSIITSFFLTMALYPDAQRRGQMAVDAITGRSRLPTFADRSALPLVDCIIKELLRWATPIPIGEYRLLP